MDEWGQCHNEGSWCLGQKQWSVPLHQGFGGAHKAKSKMLCNEKLLSKPVCNQKSCDMLVLAHSANFLSVTVAELFAAYWEAESASQDNQCHTHFCIYKS